MRITQLRVGRTYNTLHYTSQRFELEADLDEDEDVEAAFYTLARQVDRGARATMRGMGLTAIQEQWGLVRLVAPSCGAEGDDDAIPF